MWGWLGGSEEKKGDEGAEFPAPKTKEEFEALAEKTWKLMMSYEPDDGWNLLEEREGFKLYDKVLEGSASHLAKSKGILPVSPEKCMEFVKDISLENRKKWDPELLFYNVKAEITDDIVVTHVAFSAPYPVATRDFCSLRCSKKDEDGTCYIWGSSIAHESIPEDASNGYVRGNALLSSWIFRPTDDGKTQVIQINQLDPKGWIPAFVVNMSKGKAVERLIRIKELLEGSK